MPTIRPLGRGEGTVWEDTEKGRWRGQTSVNGKRHTVQGRDRNEVIRKIRKLRAAAESDDAEDVSASYTVGEWLTYWIDELAEETTEATVANRRWASHHLRPLHHLSLDALKTDHVSRLLKRKADEEYKRNSIVRMRTVLSMALDEAVRHDEVARNVARLAKIPRSAGKATEGRALTADEAGRLLAAAAEDRDGIVVVLGLYLGMRPGEVCGLEWSDVDFDTGHLEVVQMRRCDPDYTLSFVDPKEDSKRTLTMPPPVIDALKAHGHAQRVHKMAHRNTWCEHGLVVTTRVGTPIDPANHRRALKRIAEAAGIFDRLTPYDMRHTAATTMVDHGQSLSAVADQLGHKDERTLIAHYRHKRRGAVGTSAVLTDAYREVS